MTERPASWRMPTPKQMEKLAAEAARRPAVPAAAPDEVLPAEYWDSPLSDPGADDGVRLRQRKLSEIQLPRPASLLPPLRADRGNPDR
jgi:hypothetical protein